MSDRLQFWGLASLTLLSVAMLALVGITLALIGTHITPDGRVPSAEAFGFTALLLAFRELVGAIKAIWDHQDRAALTGALANSLPPAADAPSGKPGDPVHTVDDHQ